jgi:hypothetical protein
VTGVSARGGLVGGGTRRPARSRARGVRAPSLHRVRPSPCAAPRTGPSRPPSGGCRRRCAAPACRSRSPGPGGRPWKRPARARRRRPARRSPSVPSPIAPLGWRRPREADHGARVRGAGAQRWPRRRARAAAANAGTCSRHGRWGSQRATRAARRPHGAPLWPPHPFHRPGQQPLHDLLSKMCDKTEICAFLGVFSGDHPSEKTPHSLLPGMRDC